MADYNSPRPGDETRADAKAAADEARRAASSAAETAKARAGEAAHEARARVEAEAEARQKQAGEEAARVAEAFRAGEERLGGGWQARAFGYAAEASDELAHAIRDRSPGEMMGALSDFGRRNPGLFLGAATLAGFAMARVATASRHHDHGRHGGHPRAGYPAGTDPYGGFDREASRHEPGVHGMPLSPSAPTPATGPTPSASPSPTPSTGSTATSAGGTPFTRPATPGSPAASDPLSPTARPLGGPGESKKEP